VSGSRLTRAFAGRFSGSRRNAAGLSRLLVLGLLAFSLAFAPGLPSPAQAEEATLLEVPAGTELRARLGEARTEARVHPLQAFDLVGVDGSRVSSAEAEGLAVELFAVRPFRVEIRDDEDETAPFGQNLVLTWEGGGARVPLRYVPEEPGLRVSEWIRLAGESMRPLDEIDGLDLANSEYAKETVRELFPGRWQVIRDDSRREGIVDVDSEGQDQEDDRISGSGLGIAEVHGDGRTIDLLLVEGEAMRHYRAFEVWAHRDEGGGENRLIARFEEIGEDPPLREDETDWPEARMVYLPDETVALNLAVGGADMEADIAYLETARDRLRVRLTQTGPERLSGYWTHDDGSPIHSEGRQTWLRDQPQIDGVVVLDEQRGDPAYGFPYGETRWQRSDRPDYRTDRTLFVYGHGLPARHSDAVILGSPEPHLHYRFQALVSSDPSSPDARVWRQAGIDDPEERQGLILQATFSEGVGPGEQTLLLNKLPGAWLLDFFDNVGRIGFMRYNRGTEAEADYDVTQRYGDHAHERRHFLPTESLMTDEVINVEIDEEIGMPIPSIEVAIQRKDETLATVSLRRPAGEMSNYPFTSPPIRLWDLAQGGPPPPLLPDEITIGVSAGDEIAARPVDTTPLPTVPEAAKAKVFAEPGEIAQAWDRALERMAVCHGDEGRDLRRTVGEQAVDVSRFMMTRDVGEDGGILSAGRVTNVFRVLSGRSAGRFSLRINKGDHAAAILVRDEFHQLLAEAGAPYHLARLNDAAARAFLENGLERGAASDPFWKLGVVQDPRGREMPASRLLDLDRRAEDWGMSEAAAGAFAIAALRRGLDEYVLGMAETSQRLQAVDDCDLEELLLLVGRRMEPVVDRLMPRLVERVTRDGQSFWEPDGVARGYVRGLYAPGEALQALEDWASVDQAYQQMALAMATGGLAYGVGRIGAYAGMRYAATAGRYTAVAGDVADLAFFGQQAVNEYVEGQRQIEFARGAVPAVGEDILVEAEMAASPWYAAALGTLMPAGSAGLNLAALRGARNADAVRRGSRTLEQMDRLTLATVARLGDAERSDLVAHYTALVARQMRRGSAGLSTAEQRHLDRFDEFFLAAGIPFDAVPTAPGIAAAAIPDPSGIPTVRLPAPGRVAAAPPGGRTPAEPHIVRPGEPSIDWPRRVEAGSPPAQPRAQPWISQPGPRSQPSIEAPQPRLDDPPPPARQPFLAAGDDPPGAFRGTYGADAEPAMRAWQMARAELGDGLEGVAGSFAGGNARLGSWPRGVRNATDAMRLDKLPSNLSPSAVEALPPEVRRLHEIKQRGEWLPSDMDLVTRVDDMPRLLALQNRIFDDTGVLVEFVPPRGPAALGQVPPGRPAETPGTTPRAEPAAAPAIELRRGVRQIEDQQAAAALVDAIERGGLGALRRLPAEDARSFARAVEDARQRFARAGDWNQMNPTEARLMRLGEDLARQAALRDSAQRALSHVLPEALPLEPATAVTQLRRAYGQAGRELDRARAEYALLRGARDPELAAQSRRLLDRVDDLSFRRSVLEQMRRESLADPTRLARYTQDELDWLSGHRRVLSQRERELAQEALARNGNDWARLLKDETLSPAGLHRVLTFRRETVNNLLDEIIEEVARETGQRSRRLSFGSNNLTSDYDLSIRVSDGGPGAAEVVRRFNARFRDRFRGESGIVFDTNVYTDPAYTFLPVRSAEAGVRDLSPLARDHYRQGLFQEAKGRRYMTDAQWRAHKEAKLSGATAVERRALERMFAKVEANHRQTEAWKDAALARRLGGTEALQRLHQSTDPADARRLKALELELFNHRYEDLLAAVDLHAREYRRLSNLDLRGGAGNPAEGAAAELARGTAYGRALEQMQAALDEAAVLRAGGNRRAALLKEAEADALRLEWSERLAAEVRAGQGEALYFASEAYQTDGTIAHVVGELQAGGRAVSVETLRSPPRPTLSRESYLASLHENRADMYKELNGLRSPQTGSLADPDKAAAKAAKYMLRQLDAAHQAGLRLADLPDRQLIEASVALDRARGSLADVQQALAAQGLDGRSYVEMAERGSVALVGAAFRASELRRNAGEIARYVDALAPGTGVVQ